MGVGAPTRLTRRWVGSIALSSAVSLFFLYLTLRRVEWTSVREAVSHVSLPILALALLTRGLAFLAMGLRSLATTAPGGRLPYKDLVLSHLLGYTGNNILPFRMGEILRVEFLSRKCGSARAFLFGTVATERLLDSALLLAMFGLVVPFVFGREAVSGNYILLIAGTGAAFLLAFTAALWSRMPRILGNVCRPLNVRLAQSVERNARNVSLGFRAISSAQLAPGAIAGTVLYWGASAGSIAIILAAFGLDLPGFAPFVVVAVTALGTALPATPGFVGTYHYFSALGLSLMGVDRPVAISFAIVAHAMAFLPYTFLGLVLFAGSIPLWIRRAGAIQSEVGAELREDSEQVNPDPRL